MSAAASPSLQPAVRIDRRIASAVRAGLAAQPKRLPAWLFYDAAGSRLFDEITKLPEYYLTRTERGILAGHAAEIVSQAAGESLPRPRLRIVELGAGSADKTRLLLKAATELQGPVLYEPIDVSASALEAARQRIEREIADVTVIPRVADFTHGSGNRLRSGPMDCIERRMVLFIGSSIGNFEPHEALQLLRHIRAGLRAGDCFLLGVDQVKDEATLLAAYDDAAGVTAAFNRNLLARLNRELDADFDPDSFAHRAVWNIVESRIEMHLVSRIAQRVRIAALDFRVNFAVGEHIHTENSYKYRPGQAEALLAEAGFRAEQTWTDPRGWFAVCLGRAA